MFTLRVGVSAWYTVNTLVIGVVVRVFSRA